MLWFDEGFQDNGQVPFWNEIIAAFSIWNDSFKTFSPDFKSEKRFWSDWLQKSIALPLYLENRKFNCVYLLFRLNAALELHLKVRRRLFGKGPTSCLRVTYMCIYKYIFLRIKRLISRCLQTYFRSHRFPLQPLITASHIIADARVRWKTKHRAASVFLPPDFH